MTEHTSEQRQVLLTEEYLIPGLNFIDLTKLLSIAMELNGMHDQALQKYFGTSFLKDTQTWVITQYQIHINEEAKLGDNILIDTRIIDINRFFTTRRYSFSRYGQVLYEVYVQFAGIDIEKRRIVRLQPQKFDEDQFVDRRYDVVFPKIQVAGEEYQVASQSIEIEAQHIDVNNHVNNLVYLRWVYRSLPEELMKEASPKKITVKYEKEILPEDEVEMLVYDMLASMQKSQYIIYNRTQDKIASIIEIEWQ